MSFTDKKTYIGGLHKATAEPSGPGESPGYLVTHLDVNGREKSDWFRGQDFHKLYMPVDRMTFGVAMEIVLKGGAVTRSCWLLGGLSWYVYKGGYICPILGGRLGPEPKIMQGLDPTIKDIKNNLYSPANSDMLANDWVVVDVNPEFFAPY